MFKTIIAIALSSALTLGGMAWATPTKQAYWINLDAVRLINCVMPDKHHAFGTAFVVAKDRVVTANHVIYGAKSCTIDDEKVRLLHHSESLDMAVLAVDLGPDPATLPISCEPFVPGKTYYSLGYAKGEEFAMTKLIATKDHMNFVDANHKVETRGLIALNGLMIRGMSGGPVVDGDGRVVGINTLSDEEGSAGSRAVVDTPLCEGLNDIDEEPLYPMPVIPPNIQIRPDFLDLLKHLPQPILPAPEVIPTAPPTN